MLLDDVIEHRCPDFEVPQHRAGAAKESMERKAKSRKDRNVAAYSITLTSRPLEIKIKQLIKTIGTLKRVPTLFQIILTVPGMNH